MQSSARTVTNLKNKKRNPSWKIPQEHAEQALKAEKQRLKQERQELESRRAESERQAELQQQQLEQQKQELAAKERETEQQAELQQQQLKQEREEVEKQQRILRMQSVQAHRKLDQEKQELARRLTEQQQEKDHENEEKAQLLAERERALNKVEQRQQQEQNKIKERELALKAEQDRLSAKQKQERQQAKRLAEKTRDLTGKEKELTATQHQVEEKGKQFEQMEIAKQVQKLLQEVVNTLIQYVTTQQSSLKIDLTDKSDSFAKILEELQEIQKKIEINQTHDFSSESAKLIELLNRIHKTALIQRFQVIDDAEERLVATRGQFARPRKPSSVVKLENVIIKLKVQLQGESMDGEDEEAWCVVGLQKDDKDNQLTRLTGELLSAFQKIMPNPEVKKEVQYVVTLVS